MPSFFELVEQSPTLLEVQKPKGLFETLLNAHAEALYIDAEEHPDKYQDEAKALIRELVHGQRGFKDVSLTEQYLLDQATLDFASAPNPPKLPPPTAHTITKVAEVVEETEEDEDEVEDGTSEPPESELVPFWWK